MIAYLRDEPGADLVQEVLLASDSDCYAHSLNLCEVFYDFRRVAGHDAALEAIADLTRAGIIEDTSLAFVWREAAILKADLRRVSLADCFALDLARRRQAVILTADRHEFEPIVPLSLCPIHFIR